MSLEYPGRGRNNSAYSRGMEYRNVSDDGFCSPIDSSFVPNGTVGFKESGTRNRSSEGTPLKEVIPFSRPDGFRRIVAAFGVLSVVVTVALLVEIITGSPQIPPHGGVSCSSQLCSDMGVDILKKGGSAVDSAITIMLCIGVVNFHYAGLGGGGFMIIHDHKSHSSVAIDFRETAPSSASPDHFNSKNASLPGLFVGVPGELKGIKLAYERHGKLPWKKLFEPVIQLARDGFNVTRALAIAIEKRRSKGRDDKFDKFLKECSKRYANGEELKENTFIRRPDVAALLEDVAAHDIDIFYEKTAAEVSTEVGGLLSKEDFAKYKAIERVPLVTNFRDNVIESTPSPSSGAILLYLLQIMDNTSFENASPTEYHYNLALAMQEAKRQQLLLGDPLFSSEVNEIEKHLLNFSAGGFMEKEMDNSHQMNSFEDKGTSHISVIDDNDLMVSVTHSLNDYFGSLILTRSGVLLNNQLADFSFDGKMKNNRVAPGKRPLSSMVPTVAYHRFSPCRQRLSIGGTNGSRIISGVAEVIINLLGFGQSVSNAITAPRLYCGLDNVCEMQKSELSSKLSHEFPHRNLSLVERSEQPNLVEIVLKLNSSIEALADQTDYGGAAAY